MRTLKQAFTSSSISLFVACVYLFLYLPIVILVIFSFNSVAFPAPWSGFSLKWYTELFSSPTIWQAFYNSLIVASCATFLSIAMGIGLVYYIVMGGRVNKLLFLFYANSIVPEIVLAVGLLSFYSLFSVPLGLISLIVAHTVLALGYVIPLIYTRYLGLDEGLNEASYDLGATKTQTFFKITLPLLLPALIAAGLLVFILSFDDFILSFFCAGSEAQTLSLYIFSMIRSGVTPVMNALSTLLLIFSSLLVLLFCLLNAKTRIF